MTTLNGEAERSLSTTMFGVASLRYNTGKPAASERKDSKLAHPNKHNRDAIKYA
jgi:hypothetical protein